jgi:all-trans-retinol dehydrogenase (NAD+)
MNDKSFFLDKVVIVTGASSGIGRAASLVLARFKAKVVLASRNGKELEALKKEIDLPGGQALICQTDICFPDDVLKMAKDTITKWGKIDIVIANAGQYIRDADHTINLESYRNSMEINFFGTLNVIKSVLPEMKRAGKGHLVIVNSLDAWKGITGDGPYVATKAALDGFGDVLRQELRQTGIRVTSIYPSRVDTPMIENIKVPWISPKLAPEKVVKAMIRGIKRNKAVVMVPRVLILIGPLNGMFPRFLDRAYRVLRIEGEKAGEK